MQIIVNCAILPNILKAFQGNLKKVEYVGASFGEIEKKINLDLTSKDTCLIPNVPVCYLLQSKS